MVLPTRQLLTISLVLLSVSQITVFAQEESVPQTRLSSKGLAFVSLSTIPANPVSGEQTIILVKFTDPQTRAPREDFYYDFIIRNQTQTVLAVPQASTITGQVGVPFQFNTPGNYQVEIDLNDTSTSRPNYAQLDEVTFPLYVSKGEPETNNQTASSPLLENVGTLDIKSGPDTNRIVFDGLLVAAGIIIVVFIIRRRMRAKKAV